MENVIAALQRLHDHGRNHIWAYYTRNMARPVALSWVRVNVVVGNPPWINYNQTFDILRTGLENLSRNRYGIVEHFDWNTTLTRRDFRIESEERWIALGDGSPLDWLLNECTSSYGHRAVHIPESSA